MSDSPDLNVVAFRGRGGVPPPPRIGPYVQALQAEAYQDAPWLLRQLDPDNAVVFTRDLKAAYHGHGMDFDLAAEVLLNPNDDFPMAKTSPSELQDPYAYGAMRQLWIEADQLSARRGDRLMRQPLIGTLPTGLINARAVRLPSNGETAILFDDEIRVLAYMLAKVVASVVALPGDGDLSFVDMNINRVNDPERHAPQAVKWFAAMIDSYIRDGWIRILPVWVIPPEANRLALTLCHGFEMFVMGHEYGHLARNHHEGAVHETVREAEGLSEDQLQRSQEIEADAFGLRTACDSAVNECGGPIPGFWGAYLCAKAFELIDRALYCAAKRGDWKPWQGQVLQWLNRQSSHPPAATRAAMLVEMMSQGPFRAEAHEFSQAMDRLFDNLFPAAAALLTSQASVNKGFHSRFRDRAAKFMLSAPGPDSPVL